MADVPTDAAADAECVVCLEATEWRIGPCDHPLCVQCAQRWLQTTPTCPLCRTVTYGLKDWTPSPASDSTRTVHLNMPPGTHAGITLAPNAAGPVRVLRVHPADRCAASGVRKGMLVETLNGVPCVRSHEVVRMFDAARTHGAVLTVRRPERWGDRWGERWHQWLRQRSGR